ncbi:energy transducer TonB [Phenylobacterium sp.]|jgi:hypothetical protein|uniref:energy transducer TonB n=1 Tax=Phenylobacterium sp. TaxID=1871053 RepID=UPI002F92A532
MTVKLLVAVAGVTLAAAGAAAAQTPVASWAKTPTAQDVAAAYPAKAKAAGVGGQVMLSCTLNRALSPRDCVVTREQPSGYGFGNAARRLAEGLVAAPGGALLKGVEVEVPVAFPAELASGAAPVVRNPSYAAIPSAADFQVTFPKTENGVNSVRVALVCTAAAGGALADCAVDREEPAGMGYGQAALALAPKFRVAAWSNDGQPTWGAKVRVPIRYELKPVDQAAR